MGRTFTLKHTTSEYLLPSDQIRILAAESLVIPRPASFAQEQYLAVLVFALAIPADSVTAALILPASRVQRLLHCLERDPLDLAHTASQSSVGSWQPHVVAWRKQHRYR
jgi:hypothetical protein